MSQEHSLLIMFSICVCLCVCSLFHKNYTSSLSSTHLKSFCHDTTVHLSTGKLICWNFNFFHTFEERSLEASKGRSPWMKYICAWPLANEFKSHFQLQQRKYQRVAPSPICLLPFVNYIYSRPVMFLFQRTKLIQITFVFTGLLSHYGLLACLGGLLLLTEGFYFAISSRDSLCCKLCMLHENKVLELMTSQSD